MTFIRLNRSSLLVSKFKAALYNLQFVLRPQPPLQFPILVAFYIFKNKHFPFPKPLILFYPSCSPISSHHYPHSPAQISYNSTSHNLSVLFTGLINNVTEWQFIYYIVDLRDHLPEWVTFGFSAATATATAMHTIYTCDFSSEDIVTKPIVVAESPSLNLAPNPRKNNGLGLAVGLGVGGSFFVWWVGFNPIFLLEKE